MIETDLGKVVLLPMGIYTSTSTYNFLDFVSYEGNSYVAKQNVPIGVTTGNNDYWQLLAEKGGDIQNISLSTTTENSSIYRITYGNNSYFDYEVPNGKNLYLNFDVNVDTGDLYAEFDDDAGNLQPISYIDNVTNGVLSIIEGSTTT